MCQMIMSGEYIISLVLSSHCKNLKQRASVTAWLQLSFIWRAKENTSLRCEGSSVQFSHSTECPTLWDPMDCSTPGLPVYHQVRQFTQTHVHWVDDANPKEERGSILAPLFICFFFSSPSLPYVNWISQEGCLLHLRFSFQSSDLPLIYFHGLFPFFVFYPPLFWLLFPLLTA